MPENPARKLYEAWDAMHSVTIVGHRARHLRNNLPQHADLNMRPYTSSGWYGALLMVNHRTGIQAVATDRNGKFIYTLGYLYGGKVGEALFQIDAQGNFRLGSAFQGYQTRGAYERVEQHTFLGVCRAYRATFRDRIWWFKGFDSDRMWCNPRDWRSHHYYWRENSVSPSTWLVLKHLGHTWQVDIAPGDPEYADQRQRLVRQYQEAEAYYAKWRRKYFRENGIPDPQQPLDASEVETVDYIAQHLRVYEPPKARLPA